MKDLAIDYFQTPKADLHIHLEGCVSPQRLQQLAIKNHVNLNAKITLSNQFSTNGIQEPVTVPKSFAEFIKIYLKISECLQTPEDIELVMTDICKQASEFNVTALHVYFTPYTHLLFGKDLSALFTGLMMAQSVALNQYKIKVCWIFDIARGSTTSGEETLNYALEAKSLGIAVNALALAGDELRATPRQYADVFAAAKSAGFWTLAHCGEQRGPEDIEEALTYLKPHRLGHALSLLQDTSLLKHCIETQIPIEVCPYSNFLLVGSSPANHPLVKMVRSGLCITLCSDDPGILQRSLKDNYSYGLEAGLSQQELIKIAETSVKIFTDQDASGNIKALH